MTSLRPVSGGPAALLALLSAWDAAPGDEQGAAEPEPLVLETSGSTGRPKRVALSRRAMRASADATHARLGGPGRWVLNLPPTYVAGLQVLFRSVRAGTEPVYADGPLSSVADRQHDRVADRLDDRSNDRSNDRPNDRSRVSRTYVSLVPTQLVRALEDDREAEALCGFDAVLVGGGPLRPETRSAAERRGVPVVATYGTSETCGGCVYDGFPLDGVGVKVDAEGQVLLTGPVLFDGYPGEPVRTAEALDGGWLRTRDLGELDEDGRLRVLGRVDDVILSGGVNVPPQAVEAMLAGHPAVAGVVVVGLPDHEWGQRVVAVVEPRRTARSTTQGTRGTQGMAQAGPPLAELRDLVTPRAWAPRQRVVVDALPLLTNGKVDRRAAARLAQQTAVAPVVGPP